MSSPPAPPRRRKRRRSAVASRGIAEETVKPREDWEDVRRIARLQKALIGLLTVYLAAAAWQYLGPVALPPAAFGAAFIGLLLASAGTTLALTARLFDPTDAGLLAVAALLPGVGLLAMGWTIHTARLYLERENVEVGAFGVDLSRFR